MENMLFSQISRDTHVWGIKNNTSTRLMIDIHPEFYDWRQLLENIEEINIPDLESILSKNVPADLILIKNSLQKCNLLEVLYLLVLSSRFRKTFLVADRTPAKMIRFCRRLGLQGIIHSREVALNLKDIHFVNHNSFMVSKNVVEVKENHSSHDFFFYDLGRTEIEVFYLMSIGLTNTQISDKIHKSYHTIKNHKSNIVKKAGLKSTSELLALSVQLNTFIEKSWAS